MNKILRMIKEIKSFAIGNNLYADIGNAQTIGTREKQDDSFGTCIKPYGVQAIVADGIGGYVNGKLASQITVETFLDEFDKRDVTDNLSYFSRRQQFFLMSVFAMNSEKPRAEQPWFP